MPLSFRSKVILPLMLATVLNAGLRASHAQPAPKAAPVMTVPASEHDLAETRQTLLKLLKESPTLTDVLASDPSLLANQEYIARTNPEVARLLESHPEIARNPEFYLFADLPHDGRNRVEALERRVWTGAPPVDHYSETNRLFQDIGPMILCVVFLVALGWLIKALLANRRWGRIFKLQTEVHGKLIEKMGSSEELLTYMQTDAGKRFLEAAPIPVDFERDERMPAVLQRVLLPLTAGIVLTLLGVGFIVLRHALPDAATPLLVFGVTALMPGVGCIIAAGVTWSLASRLGLMPERGSQDAQ